MRHQEKLLYPTEGLRSGSKDYTGDDDERMEQPEIFKINYLERKSMLNLGKTYYCIKIQKEDRSEDNIARQCDMVLLLLFKIKTFYT